MVKKVTWSGKVLTPEGVLESGVVEVIDGKITAIAARAEYTQHIDVDMGALLIAPGFIDIHIHGAKGHRMMNANREGNIEALQHHLRHGTTGLLATTSTATDETIAAGLELWCSIQKDQLANPELNLGSAILGAHIEGPYLNPVRAGGQKATLVRPADVQAYQKWEQTGLIKMITIAPEMPGAEALIRYIRDNSDVLISAGHTDASFEQIEASMQWGVSHLTHFTNAMRGFRECEPGVFEPGVFGAGLLLQDLTVELITDGIHVHPRNLELIYRTKGAERIAIITDAVSFCGMPDGIYAGNGGQSNELEVRNGAVRMKENGGLSGSLLTMNRAAKMMADLGVPLSDVWKMAAAVPARLIGELHRKGEIKVGMDADIIAIDEAFEVQHVMLGGHLLFSK